MCKDGSCGHVTPDERFVEGVTDGAAYNINNIRRVLKKATERIERAEQGDPKALEEAHDRLATFIMGLHPRMQGYKENITAMYKAMCAVNRKELEDDLIRMEAEQADKAT